MSLTLTLRHPDPAPEGVVPSFTVAGDVAVIGRSKVCDWNLPDPSNIVSSRHAEIRRDGAGWLLRDISTNGTFLNDAAERMAAEHRIADGDLIRIGGYELVAALAEPAPPAAPEPVAEPTIVRPAGDAPAAAQPAAAAPAAENATMLWDSVADINKVDWARAGLGADAPAVAAPAGEAESVDALLDAFIAAAGLDEAGLARSPELVGQAGALLRRLVAGLAAMVEARARAKAQMGAEATGLQLEGNNPIKFARTPDQALARLLGPPEPGFMAADRAVEDAFLDLQSHQMATLRAIPGALRATLDRFSPGAVRRRADKAGLLARLLPALQDAALWRNYERDYVKVKNESDEAFMEVFAREFRKAYERQLREGLGGK